MRLLVLPGDGMCPEITEATVGVLRAASERFQLGLELMPDIADRDIANPFSLSLSASLLLDWDGRRTGQPRFGEAAQAIDRGVAEAMASGETTADVGGRLGTAATGAALTVRLQAEG